MYSTVHRVHFLSAIDGRECLIEVHRQMELDFDQSAA